MVTSAILVPNPSGTGSRPKDDHSPSGASLTPVRDNVRCEPLCVRVTWMAIVRLNYLAPDNQQPLSH
jgi:hypothetical protein